MKKRRAVLGLADGSHLLGYSYGSPKTGGGELVFNTSMTGYQEIISDPSYAGQVITFTYPHIGNVGVNSHDYESTPVRAAGVVLRDTSPIFSNYRAEKSLAEFLEKHECPAISNLDTRMLTRKLRDEGCLNSCILSFEGGEKEEKYAVAEAIKIAKEMPPIGDKNLAELSSRKKEQEWQDKTIAEFSQLPVKVTQDAKKNSNLRILVYDCGIKNNIARLLKEHGGQVSLLPYGEDAAKVIAKKPHGIVISNGPGDPLACGKMIKDIQSFSEAGIPILGICLGQQLIGLANGAKIAKMKFGHHGANHPVKKEADNLVMITSQNHNYTLDDKNLPQNIEVTHRSLFDGSIQGIKIKGKPIIAFQGHPEASPGPHDAVDMFGDFIELAQKYSEAG